MRHLLLVAYHFPPEPAAGALRPKFLATHLPEFGWDVTVLTRPYPTRETHALGYRVVTAPVLGESMERSLRGALGLESAAAKARRPSLLRRALRWGREALFFPDRTAGWLPAAIRTALAVSRRDRFDAVLSTAMPATVHVVGAAVAQRRHLPWIADYRDPWTGNAYAARTLFRNKLEADFERFLIRRASALTTISAPIAAQLETLHQRDVGVIENAGDPGDWSGLETIAPSSFELCYTGTLYDGRRSPALLFETLATLRSERDPAGDARIIFFGPNSENVGEMARRFGVDALVDQRGTVPRRQALAAQRHASTLLIFLNMDESTAHELGSKVYEYAGARRPIVAFGPRNSAMRKYLQRYDLGWFASDPDEAKAALRAAHGRFVTGAHETHVPAGAVPHPRDLAEAFAAQLDSVLRKN